MFTKLILKGDRWISIYIENIAPVILKRIFEQFVQIINR